MFDKTIDNKPTIIDKNGNEIVDLAKSIFSRSARGLNAYHTVKLNSNFQMRADKVAFAEYKTDKYTEYILKYSGVSNPFSIDKDDVLFIPNPTEADAQMQDLEETQTQNINQVQNYYKFTNKDFKSDSTSYDNLANKEIPSGRPKFEENAGFMVPYISDEGTPITIKNGRIYFGTDAGNVAMPNTEDVEQYKKDLAAALDTKCATNGMSLTDFVRASVVNAKAKSTVKETKYTFED